MNALPKITDAPLADPHEVLEVRAWARAYLWSQGEFELDEAVDGLQAAAVSSGLVRGLGQDAVRQIIADAFRPLKGVAWSLEFCRSITATHARAF